VLLIAAFVLIAGLYSVIVPPFETPDEIWHFAFIQYVATGHGLPVSAPNTQELWRQEGVQAPGYYLAAAALTVWVDQSDFPALYARANPHAAIGRPDAVANRNYLVHHPDEAWPWHGSVLALHLARFFSVVLGAITLWAVNKTLALLLDPGVALLGTALFAFVPQFVFISAAASNDNAINALAGLVLWRLVALVVAPAPDLGRRTGAWLSGWSAGNRDLFWIGCLLGLAVLAKLSALGLVALAGLAVLIVAWPARSWRVLLRAALWIGLPALAIGGWWYVRNWRLYGDPLAWNVWQANILLRGAPADWQTILSELVGLERSFWGLFGWLNLSYPAWVYGGFRALEILTAGGLVAGAAYWLLRVRSVDRRWLGAGLLLGWLVLLVVSWLRFTRIAPAAQGRYFHPGAPAIALLLALGLSGACFGLKRSAGGAGSRRTGLAAVGWAAAAGLLALSLATPFWVIRPAYATPIAAESFPALTPVRAELGDQFAILGVAAEPAELVPGASATVTVRWQALNPGPVDYSVFVHLLDGDGLVVAQADSMPGGGLLPTSAWLPGQIRTERYEVVIPALAYAPDQGRWSVGLYDHRTNQRLPLRLLELAGETARADAPGIAVEEDGLAFGAAAIRAPAGSVPNAVNVEFYDNVTLAGYSFSSRRLHPGDSLTVNLYWRARGPVQKEYTAFAHLLDESYETQGGHDGAPRPPKSAWPSDQVVQDTHVFTVASGASPGLYQVEVGLYSRPEFDRLRLIQPGAAVGADRVLIGPLRVVR